MLGVFVSEKVWQQRQLLVTVDQRAMKFDQPVTFKIDPGVTGIDELANMAYEGRLDGGEGDVTHR